MNPAIFRTYDVRGITGVDFVPEDAEAIGRAFGTFIQKKYSRKHIVVGHDNRYSSPQLRDYFVQGLLSTGCQVTDIGLVVTPLLYYAVIRHGFDGGCMITASHNPKEFNGFKFEGRDGVSIFNHELQEIRQIAEKGDFVSGVGSVSYRELFSDYVSDISNRVHLQRRLKVVLDCGNGAASEYAPRLYEALGVNVIQQHCTLHGDFPHHVADPERRINMEDTIKKVLETKADLGIAFDTDGDRYGVVDEKGELYSNDLILIMLARDVLRRFPGSRIIYDVKSSYVLEDEIKKAGGVPQMLRTGHPYFKDAMRRDPSILIGAEVSSHTFIRDNYYGYDDGLFAGLRLLEVLSRNEKTFSEHFADVEKTYHTEELHLPTPDDKKEEIIAAIQKSMEQDWELITIDGVRVVFDQRSWGLVRASNTSPYISARFEANSEARLKEIMNILAARLDQHPVVDMTNLRALL